VDGTDALRLLAVNVYSAIVSDLAMPKLDGRGLFHEVERRYPASQSRLVFVTGYAEAEEYDEFLRHSGVPVLAKPFTIADLVGAVQRASRRPEGGPGAPGRAVPQAIASWWSRGAAVASTIWPASCSRSIAPPPIASATGRTS
jgi:CheY-like chemotaxis protein